jgi:hypothetical protein
MPKMMMSFNGSNFSRSNAQKAVRSVNTQVNKANVAPRKFPSLSIMNPIAGKPGTYVGCGCGK